MSRLISDAVKSRPDKKVGHDVLIRLAFVGILLGFYWVLRFVYIEWITPTYDYAGLGLQDESAMLRYFGLALVLVVGFVAPIRDGEVSEFVLSCISHGVVVPCAALWPLMLEGDPFTTAGWLVILMAGYLTMLVCTRPWARRLRLPLSKMAFQPVKGYEWVVVGGVLLLMAIWLLSLNSWQLDLGWDTVYDRRSLARELIPGGSVAAYLIAAFNSCLIPLGCVGMFIYRKLWLFPVVVIAVLASFSVEAGKATLLAPFFLGLAAAIAHLPFRWRTVLFSSGFLVAVVACAIEYHVLGDSVVGEVFVRRILAVPARLSGYFFDYATGLGIRWFAGSNLGVLLGGSGDISTPRLIGLLYMNNFETNANTNLFASGFIEFGVPGVVLAGLLAGLLVQLIERVRSSVPVQARILVGVWCGIVWTQQAIHTSLLSSGIIFLILGVNFMPSLPGASSERVFLKR